MQSNVHALLWVHITLPRIRCRTPDFVPSCPHFRDSTRLPDRPRASAPSPSLTALHHRAGQHEANSIHVH